MSPGQMLPGQMLGRPLESVLDVPRNLRLKFGQETAEILLPKSLCGGSGW